MDGLHEAGESLWEAIHALKTVTAAHVPLVLNACRVADNLERITGELAVSGLTSVNARGDEVASPLLVEHRMQLAVLRQVLGALGVEKLASSGSGRPSLQDQLAAAREARLAREAK